MASETSLIRSWAVVLLCVAVVLLQGMFVFFVVGNPQHNDWDFRPVKDVPGQSPYAIYQRIPHGQHVRGAEGD
jgi:hypothetical protein